MLQLGPDFSASSVRQKAQSRWSHSIDPVEKERSSRDLQWYKPQPEEHARSLLSQDCLINRQHPLYLMSFPRTRGLTASIWRQQTWSDQQDQMEMRESSERWGWWRWRCRNETQVISIHHSSTRNRTYIQNKNNTDNRLVTLLVRWYCTVVRYLFSIVTALIKSSQWSKWNLISPLRLSPSLSRPRYAWLLQLHTGRIFDSFTLQQEIEHRIINYCWKKISIFSHSTRVYKFLILFSIPIS